jgi:hypothetical protein
MDGYKFSTPQKHWIIGKQRIARNSGFAQTVTARAGHIH